MNKKTDHCVILFADISNSTRLYDKYGDSIAKDNIDTCLEILERITKEYKGTLIKTIGDEIMCTFIHVDDAYLASCSMHEQVIKHQSLQKLGMTIQIGFHCGQVIKDNDDVFGDTVNVAARITSLANATKTLITGSVVEQLSAAFKNDIRPFDRVSIKGKSDPLRTWEILWKTSDSDMTIMVGKPHQRTTRNPMVTLTVENKKYPLQQHLLPLVIGRSNQADIFVDSKLVSRTHVVIDYSRGNFIITDKSTNGSYIKAKDGKSLFFKNEHVFLVGQGEISLGEPIKSESPHVINYVCS